MNEFEQFQAYFKEYQQRFGLNGYELYFKHEPIEGGFAGIRVDLSDMVAVVTFASNISKKEKAIHDIKQSAQHEAIHLLLMRLTLLAKYRYTTKDEIYEAVKEVEHKLEGLISERE